MKNVRKQLAVGFLITTMVINAMAVPVFAAETEPAEQNNAVFVMEEETPEGQYDCVVEETEEAAEDQGDSELTEGDKTETFFDEETASAIEVDTAMEEKTDTAPAIEVETPPAEEESAVSAAEESIAPATEEEVTEPAAEEEATLSVIEEETASTTEEEPEPATEEDSEPVAQQEIQETIAEANEADEAVEEVISGLEDQEGQENQEDTVESAENEPADKAPIEETPKAPEDIIDSKSGREVHSVSKAAAEDPDDFEDEEEDPIEIYDAEVVLDQSVFYKNEINAAPRPGVTVTLNGVLLTEGTDYEVTYENDSSVGWHYVDIDGIGKYTGYTYAEYQILRGEQTVTCTSPISKTYGDAVFSLDAATSGDGRLVYSSSNTSVVEVSSAGRVAIKGAGGAVISIYAAATAKYNESPVKKVSVRVDKAAQAVTVKTTKYTKTFGDPIFALNASSNGDGRLIYSSSNTKVATVSNTGRVSIKGAGGAVITIYAKETADYKKSAIKKVTVKVAKKAQTVSVKKTAITKTFGDANFSLGVSRSGDGALIYKSSNPKVATVSSTGVVTINRGGGTVITVYAKETANYKKSAVKKITIKVQQKEQKVTATSTYNKTIGQKAFTIKASSNGTGKLVFASSNKNVAVVNSNGVVTMKSPGTAKITVYAKANSKYKKSAVKTITINVKPKKVTLSKVTNNGLNMFTANWGASAGVTGYQLQYAEYSDFSDAVTVTVSGVKNKSRTISDLTRERTYYVRVRAYKKSGGKNVYSDWSAVKSVRIDKYAKPIDYIEILNKGTQKLVVGFPQKLELEYYPSDTTDEITVFISDPSVVSVDSNGLLTGLRKGTATVTVKASSGKTDQIKVEVHEKDVSSSNTVSYNGITVTVLGLYKTKDSYGNTIAAAEFLYTNENTEPYSFMSAIDLTAYQNGIELNRSGMNLERDYDWDTYYTNIKDGATIVVYRPIPLLNEGTPVEISVKIMDRSTWTTGSSLDIMMNLSD